MNEQEMMVTENDMPSEVVVFFGDTAGGRWSRCDDIKELTLDEASQQVASHFNCTVENARESLLRNGYASACKGTGGTKHWHVKGGNVQGTREDRW